MIQLGVKECLLQGNDKGTDHELAKLKMLVERCGVIVTERKAGELVWACLTNVDIAADFVTSNVEQDLNRLLDESASATALRELRHKSKR